MLICLYLFKIGIFPFEPPLMEKNLALGPNHKVFEKFVFGANFIFFWKKKFITFLDVSDLQDHHIKF